MMGMMSFFSRGNKSWGRTAEAILPQVIREMMGGIRLSLDGRGAFA